MSSAAWSTPFLTTDQNGSDASPCAPPAMVMPPRWAKPPPPPPSPPPPHPATSATPNTTAASAATRLFALDLPILFTLSERFPSPSPALPSPIVTLLQTLAQVGEALADLLHRPLALRRLGLDHRVLLKHVPPRIA